MLSPSQKTAKSMRNKPSAAQFFLLAAIFLNSSVSVAEMYKWVDEEGRTHYTQSPPPGDIEASTIKPPPKINPEHAQKQLENRKNILDGIDKSRKDKKEEVVKQEQDKEKKAADCEKARKRLASYQRPRIMVKDADGNPSRLDEKQRMAEQKKSRELIEKLCN